MLARCPLLRNTRNCYERPHSGRAYARLVAGLYNWTARLAFAFLGKALVERMKIDHHSLMRSAADLFHLVARRHLEFDPFSLALDHLGFGTNIMTYSGSSNIPYIHRGSDPALAHHV